MGKVLSGFTDAIGLTDTQAGADAAREASGQQVAYQKEALDYLKESEAVPQHYRESAIGQLGTIYGMPSYSPEQQAKIARLEELKAGGSSGMSGLSGLSGPGGLVGKVAQGLAGATGDSRAAEIQALEQEIAGFQPVDQSAAQESFFSGLENTPLYRAIMGGQAAGEESLARNLKMTGGLRSGNTQEALYDYNTQLKNRALLESYGQQVSGLQGLAGLQSYAPQIASGTQGIGATMAAGTIGAQQSETAAQNQLFSDALSLGGMFI